MRSQVGQNLILGCGERSDARQLGGINVQADSVTDGDIRVRLRHIPAIVVVLLAQEEVVKVVVCRQDIGATLLHGQQEVSPVG